MRAIISILAFFAILSSNAFADVYYIDLDTGSDTNSGTSTASPWKTIPGTRNTSNSGWQSTDWGKGTINSSKKVSAGTIFRIKSGTTHDSRDGGRILIDATYYNDADANSPIRLERDEAWGVGQVVIDGAGMSVGTWQALFEVQKTDYFQTDGKGKDGIVVRNSAFEGVLVMGTSQSSQTSGVKLINMKIANSLAYNLVLQSVRDFEIINVEVDGNKQDGGSSGGFHIGGEGYGCSNGLIANSISHDNGNSPGTQAGGTDARIGFWVTDSDNITLDNCTAYNNEGDGFDFGTVSNYTLADNITVRNSTSYNNADGFACNVYNTAGNSRFYFYNNISRNNSNGFNIYEGPTAYVYNNVIAYNRRGLYADAPSQQNRNTYIYLKNNIFYKNSNTDLDVLRATDMVLESDYNLFQYGTNNRIVRWNYGVVDLSYYYFGTSKLFDDWVAEQKQDLHSFDSEGDGKTAAFINDSLHDYRLLPDSDAIDSGGSLGPQYELDRTGVKRPVGLAWDMGAYEYTDLKAEIPSPPRNLKIIQ